MFMLPSLVFLAFIYVLLPEVFTLVFTYIIDNLAGSQLQLQLQIPTS